MPFSIAEREIDQIAILDLDGRLTMGDAVEELQSRALALLNEGQNRMVLNFRNAPYIDSAGLGMLVSLKLSFEKADGSVRLLNLSKRHVELLVLTRLSTEFEIFEDERDAVDSFFPNRAPIRFDILEFVRRQEEERAEADGRVEKDGEEPA